MDSLKVIGDVNWKLIVEYEGEKLKDLYAKVGELEIVECGSLMVSLEVNGKDVSKLVNDKRRKKIREIAKEAISDIKSEWNL